MKQHNAILIWIYKTMWKYRKQTCNCLSSSWRTSMYLSSASFDSVWESKNGFSSSSSISYKLSLLFESPFRPICEGMISFSMNWDSRLSFLLIKFFFGVSPLITLRASLPLIGVDLKGLPNLIGVPNLWGDAKVCRQKKAMLGQRSVSTFSYKINSLILRDFANDQSTIVHFNLRMNTGINLHR